MHVWQAGEKSWLYNPQIVMEKLKKGIANRSEWLHMQ
jgi:hypothetical protein